MIGSFSGGFVSLIDNGVPVVINASPFADYTGAVAVAVGDVNGDQIPDIVTMKATAGPAEVKVFDGATLALQLWFTAFPTVGASVAVGDLDGDGRAEIVVSSTAQFSGVGIYDELSGALRYGFLAYQGFAVGSTVAVGDLDGDGRAEIVTAPVAPVPLIRVYTGGGAFVREFMGFDRLVAGAGATVAVGDLNGDGTNEILAGANIDGGDSARVLNATGSVRAEVPLPARRARGRTLLGPQLTVADLNGDSVADLVFSAGTAFGAFTGPGLSPLGMPIELPDQFGGVYLG